MYYFVFLSQMEDKMNINNIFYLKDIVDGEYPDENRPPVNIQQVVDNVKDSITCLSNEDFSEILISCFIPDLYSGMGKREKLFTKLTELMVGEWWRRMGGDYRLPTKKSGTEDVELTFDDVSIACDAKVFRLGRSQKAPNVKDFLKLASVRLWIGNLNKGYSQKNINRHVIGGLVTYSSLHEWEKDSEVYTECTNHKTPVVMLPYEVMAFLLKYHEKYDLSKFIALWDYKKNKVITSRMKDRYWDYIETFICNLTKVPRNKYKSEIKDYHRDILKATSEYKKLIQKNINQVKEKIQAEINEFNDINRLKEYACRELERRDNADANKFLEHINTFRYYLDQTEN